MVTVDLKSQSDFWHPGKEMGEIFENNLEDVLLEIRG